MLEPDYNLKQGRTPATEQYQQGTSTKDYDNYCAQAVRPMTTEEIIEQLFTYHSPGLDQLPRYEAIRDAAKYFAMVICKNTPRCADQSAAIRLLREAVMTANASIALGGLSL